MENNIINECSSEWFMWTLFFASYEKGEKIEISLVGISVENSHKAKSKSA